MRDLARLGESWLEWTNWARPPRARLRGLSLRAIHPPEPTRALGARARGCRERVIACHSGLLLAQFAVGALVSRHMASDTDYILVGFVSAWASSRFLSLPPILARRPSLPRVGRYTSGG